MKLAYLFISGGLLLLWVLLGSVDGLFGAPIPALGEFFNPATGYWVNASNPSLSRRGVTTIQLDHAAADGTIFFDDRGVPHLFADNLTQACFLQGYVHAADRLWQMDISTRATEGSLSEILGERTVARDRKQVRLGYRHSARAEIELCRKDFPEEYALLAAYSAGINAYIDRAPSSSLPIEYKLLGHTPLRWSPYRSALLMKGMSQSLSSRYDDVERDATRSALGGELFELLFPKHLPDEQPVVPPAIPITVSTQAALPVLTKPITVETDVAAPLGMAPSPPFTAPAPAPSLRARTWLTERLARLFTPAGEHAQTAYTLLPEHPGNGSNNWAVNEARSNTGYPILASDPHLRLTLPSIWYEVQIHLPEANARGVSLPGAPGIMIGYNDDVAYGETNVGQDVTDWFEIDWVDSTRTAYRLDGETVEATYRTDTLLSKGAEPEIITTPVTVFGPVPFRDGPYADHAMRYLGHELIGRELRRHTNVMTFLHLMRASGHNDYLEALKGYVDPAQNFLYADRYNDIAIRPNGFFPVRSSGDGGFPYPGDSRANDWRGFIPFDRRPAHYNPARNYVSSANQITTGPDYPYAYTGGFDEYRGRFINRFIEKEGVMNQRSMKELQLSSHSLLAEELAPLLLARLNRNQLTGEATPLFKLVADWDYRYEGGSRAATFFERWVAKTYDLTFDELDDDEGGYLSPDKRVWTRLLRRSPDHAIFDILATTDFTESAATLVQRAFEESVEELAGSEPREWAQERQSYVRHLGAIPGFGSGLIRTAGGRYSPRVLSGGHGASWRMVVELGRHPRAWGSLPGGASGHPGSRAYDNGLDDWTNGRYHELIRWRDWEEAEVKSIGRWEFARDPSR